MPEITLAPIHPPKPIRRGASPEDRAAARQIRRRWLDGAADYAIRQFTDPEGWHRFLLAAALHPARPTVTNLALIAVQTAPSEVCKTYRQWQAEGRQVRKGEHGAMIYTSVIKADDDAPERLRGFGCGRVFGWSQTDPADGADADQQPPGPPYRRTPQELATASHIHAPSSEAHGDGRVRDALASLAAAAPGLTDQEATSAADLAAAMFGVGAGIADPLPAPQTDDPDDARDELRDAAQRVLDTGRAIAAQFAAVHLPPF